MYLKIKFLIHVFITYITIIQSFMAFSDYKKSKIFIKNINK